MASPSEKDDVPMLPISSSSSSSSRSRSFTSRFRSVSLSNTSSTIGYTGPLGTLRQPPPSVQMSGSRVPEPLFLPPPSSHSIGVSSSQLESCPSLEYKHSDDELGLKHAHQMCNDPFSTTCPSYYNPKPDPIPPTRFHDAKGWSRRFAISVNKYLTGVINPHYKFLQRWIKLFALWLVIFIDPLFLFLIKVKKNDKCIMIDWPVAKPFIAVRSVTDVLFLFNILHQLFDHPRKNAHHYLRGKFLLDLFIVLPLPQMWILWILPAHLGESGGNYAKNFLTAAVLFQYIPKLCRLLPLLAGKTPTVFLVDSACSFVINLLTFMLVGHVVGSCWYLFGLQRVNHCLRDACGNSHQGCRELIYCGHGNSHVALAAWKDNESAIACFQESDFQYGIYVKAVNLTSHARLITRYIYSLLWGFQQISTLAGNQVPSYFLGEASFTMVIIALGLLLFPLLIGNMQNFLQALGRRNLEMSHKQFLDGLKGRVRLAEWVKWAATRGFNEKLLFENMPNDLQRDIRRDLFIFLKKGRIFSTMDESILDAIRERLTHRRYISSSTVLHRGGLVEKMVFIVRGEMESIGEYGSVLPLSEGDVCGEELLSWCLGCSSVNPDGTRIRMPSKGLVSKRRVRCLTDVEAFSLSVADLEDITSLFLRFLRCHSEQGAIRSPRRRLRVPRQIQVLWRPRRRQLQRFYTAQSSFCNL